jgi:hypothetical protein
LAAGLTVFSGIILKHKRIYSYATLLGRTVVDDVIFAYLVSNCSAEFSMTATTA